MNVLSVWMAVVGTASLMWAFWRQSRPIVRVRVQTEVGMVDDPRSDEVAFTVANTGAVAVTLSKLALSVHPTLFWRLTGFPQSWHNMVRRDQPSVKLPKHLAVGEQWMATVKLNEELLEHLERGNLRYRATFSHRGYPYTGKIRRQGLLDLLRCQ